MRKTISVAALLLALTCPAYAGDIQNDSPKPPANMVQEPTLRGTVEDATQGSLTTTLDLLAALLSLF